MGGLDTWKSTAALGCALLGLLVGRGHAAPWTEESRPDGLFQLSSSGQVSLDGLRSQAHLALSCTRDALPSVHGTRALDLVVEGVDRLQRFHWDDLEGPQANAGPLLSVRAVPGRAFRVRQSGRYLGASTFAFGFFEPSSRATGHLARLLDDVQAGAQFIELTVTDPRDRHRRLVARFELDAQDARFEKLRCR